MFQLELEPYVPLVVVDFSVYAWSLVTYYERALHIYPENTVEIYIKALWAAKLNRGPDFLPLFPHTVVIIGDYKDPSIGGYWRHHEILTDSRVQLAWAEFTEKKPRISKKYVNKGYKGMREGRDDSAFKKVYEIGIQYARKYFDYVFLQKQYEADDIAGVIYRMSLKAKSNVIRERQILFSTVDRDWSQLVDESHKCFFANYRYPRPNEKFQERLVDESGVIAHTEHKLGETISHPNQLAAVKSRQGDLGDNLPPGAPIEYFDLCYQHPTYSLEENPEFYNRLLTYVSTPEPNNRLDHLQESINFAKKLGLEMPIII